MSASSKSSESGPGNPIERLASLIRSVPQTAANVTEYVRHGGFEVDVPVSPWHIVASGPVAKLRHYFPDDVPEDAPAMILVPPLMMATEMWDIEPPKTSAVADLHRLGIDVWVIDFGHPDKEPGGLKRTLTDHVMALSEAVDVVTRATGKDVTIGGQSQGGMFCYQVAAYRRGEGIESVVTFGSPVDVRAPLALPISPDRAAQLAEMWLDLGIADKLSVPGWAMKTGTRMIDPVSAFRAKLAFYRQLHDRESLLPRERQRQFLDNEGWTWYSAPAFAELIEQFFINNRMLEGGFSFGDRLVTLADIERPILTVIGDKDVLGHPLACRGIRRAAPNAEIYELLLSTGHFGLIASGLARKVTWPSVAGWLHWRNGTAERPEPIVLADEITSTTMPTDSTRKEQARRIIDLGIGTAYAAKTQVGATRRGLRRLADDAVSHLPRLTPASPTHALRSLHALTAVRPVPTLTLGQLLDDIAEHSPEDVVYLFGDRVIRSREFKHRVDAVVKGLISTGVREGERVGVLMGARPSCLSAVAALNRLGATAVMLRSGGDVAREARLGGVSWIVADPEHVELCSDVPGVPWCLLGVGSAERVVPEGVVDLEQVTIEAIRVPTWFRANPRRPEDIAFVMFRGSGDRTLAVEISNHRWALSAATTAAMAELKPGDTFYATTPMSHPSSLLMAVGGVVASGARLAFASAPDVDTFWREVRRYGATHVSYTWSSLSSIVDAPPDPREQHHPIRLFVGSGMPRGLWERLEERFAPARILEFFASTAGEVILANRPGTKAGGGSRPVPGSAEVKVAAYDLAQRRLILGRDGLGREVNAHEPGMLVARVDTPRLVSRASLRSVFESGDAWQPTGEIFTRDEDGDLWHLDTLGALIDTQHGTVSPGRIADHLCALPEVAAAVAFGEIEDERTVVVAAVEPVPGATLSAAAVQRAFGSLPTEAVPHVVRVVAAIPTNAWGRYDIGRAHAVDPIDADQVWRRGPNGRTFRRDAAGA